MAIQEPTHSPLPWSVGFGGESIKSAIAEQLPDWTPVVTPAPPFAFGASSVMCANRADAEFICRAVNAHDELLAALKAVHGHYYLGDAEDLIAEAIQRAEGSA